jgi:23S rRNA pseudouridine1911/1915/1917 synthase
VTLSFTSTRRPHERNLPLVDYLAQRFTYHSRAEWERLIAKGEVTEEGQEVTYTTGDYHEPPMPTHFEVIFEDENFLIANKPAGIPVHSTGRIVYNTFTNVLRRSLDLEELMPLHRLDAETSGLILFAKNSQVAKRWQKNINDIILRKIYVAVCEGIFPEGELLCELPLAEDKNGPLRLKMVPTEGGKSCATRFRRVGVLKRKDGRQDSIVLAELLTGRKHQIRAHLAALGHPIVNDKIYGNAPQDLPQKQMLHACEMWVKLPPGEEARVFYSSPGSVT